MASLAQLQTWLTEAEAKRHAVAMGEAVHEVMRANRKMVFTSSNLEALDAYIAQLKTDIAAAQADAAGTRRRSAIGTVW